MAITAARFTPLVLPPASLPQRRRATAFSPTARSNQKNLDSKIRLAASTTEESSTSSRHVENGPSRRIKREGGGDGDASGVDSVKVERDKSLKDYFEEAKEMIKSDGGPPRWFTPLECGAHDPRLPLLLYLPGIDGVGVGLVKQHQRLGQIFDVWCLHIPVEDRTSFSDLVKLVEGTVESQLHCFPNRPIYLIGESLGACIALAVAARNPDMDLTLILANPATSFSKSQLQSLISILKLLPDQVPISASNILRLLEGNHLRMAMANLVNRLPPDLTLGELSQNVLTVPAYLSVVADMLPKETLLWKLEMLQIASAYANSRLHAVKAQTLILTSGRDLLFPSQVEGEKLRSALSKSQIRRFDESGHFLFLENGVDLVTVIKAAGFYRRGKYIDYVSDFMPPTSYEFLKLYESNRWVYLATSPVFLSTLEDGRIVRSLAGIPEEGPVLFVGYHMLLGLELHPLVLQFMNERNILLRGIAHPMMFAKRKDGKLPELSAFDNHRLMGAVPVSAANFFKLLSSKSHVLLYPGGMREALHRKGEEYKLFWPEHSEFVRMAARFGAKIIPFGVVGEDDYGQVVFDYDDLMKIPYFRSEIEDLTNEVVKLRNDASGEVANQDIHLPGILPKMPGRFYFLFGKPIETEGRKLELRDREKCHELYLEVKSEVEKCIFYLKERRENDPYRNLFSRLIYQATNGFTSQVPTFEL